MSRSYRRPYLHIDTADGWSRREANRRRRAHLRSHGVEVDEWQFRFETARPQWVGGWPEEWREEAVRK